VRPRGNFIVLLFRTRAKRYICRTGRKSRLEARMLGIARLDFNYRKRVADQTHY
jgi:hypothetical protein